MIGKGDPTIGSKPRTIAIFTVIYTNIAEPKPKQKNLPKKFLDKDPILKILNIKIAYKISNRIEPIKPNSSEKRVNIKSVCFSGK